MMPATPVRTSSAKSRSSSGSRSNVRVLNAARSTNTTLTRRRSRPVTWRPSGVPHMPQKRIPAGLGVPQAAQITRSPPQQRRRVDERATCVRLAPRVELQDVVRRQRAPAEISQHRSLVDGVEQLDERLPQVHVDAEQVAV